MQNLKAKADLSKFWVITPISNVARFKRRYELYHRFKEMCECAGVNLLTVELALGDRQFMITDRDNPNHVQLRSVEEYWHKEVMINAGIEYLAQLDPEAREAAWIDADCRPAQNPRAWFEETWHELQHFEFVQMWEWILDLDYDQNPIGRAGPSFMANYIKYGTPYPEGIMDSENKSQPYAVSWGSPGLAWAANISALNKIGKLPDEAILGAGDWYLAHMLTSGLDFPAMNKYSAGYRNRFIRRQELCERWIKRDVGFVKGLVLHDFHGKKKNRKYNTREQILIENQYDPDLDLKKDSQGIYQLETWDPRQIRLRDQIRQYFRQRNEDSIDA